MTDDRKSSEDLIREARDRLRVRDQEPELEPTLHGSMEPSSETATAEPEPIEHVYRSQMEEPSPPPEAPEFPPPGTSPQPWYTRRWLRLVIVPLIFLGYGFFTTLDDAERDETGQIVGAGDLDVLTVEVGDCFDDPSGTDVVFDLAAVPCSEPHDNEVFAVESVDGLFGTDYPGQAALEDYALERCSGPLFAEFVGTNYLDSALDVYLLTPTEESWEQGDREVVCALYRLDFAKLTGTARGSGL